MFIERNDVILDVDRCPRPFSASEMTYIVSSGALNSTHSLVTTRVTGSKESNYPDLL